MFSLLVLKKLCSIEKAKLNGVVLVINGKYTCSEIMSCQELGVREGDLVNWAVRIAGGTGNDETKNEEG